MTECAGSLIPMDPGVIYKKGDGSLNQRFQQAIGMLNYIAVKSRPDISYAVGKLSRFMACADETHMAGVHMVARYLSATRTCKLHYVRQEDGKGWDHEFNLVVHTDANFGEVGSEGRNTSGRCGLMDGNTIWWKSQRQTTSVTSTTAAE